MSHEIKGFKGKFGFLSNFHESSFYVDGEKYTSVEHAYQAHKTLDLTSRKLIREAKKPALAKKLGQSVEVRKDWESVKLDLMRTFVYKKFSNPFLKDLLLSTGDLKLINVNTWNDTFWGVCNNVGHNHLGIILMEVRDLLRAEASKENEIFYKNV